MINGSAKNVLISLCEEVFSNKLSLHDFSKRFEDFRESITLNDLRTKDEANGNRTLLWSLANLARINGDPFVFVWNKFKEDIDLNDLRIRPESESEKSKSVLRLLAESTILYKRSTIGSNQCNILFIFIEMFDKFKAHLTLDELREKPEAETETFSDTSMFSLLANIMIYDEQETFTWIWNKFKDHITLEDLRSKDWKDADPTFWCLAFVADKKPEIFLEVWKKFKEQITLEDLRATGRYLKPGTTALWWLAFAAHKNHPEAFLEVLKEFTVYNITLADLMANPEGNAENVLDLLLSAARGSPSIRMVFLEFMRQTHFTFDNLVLNNHDELWAFFMRRLIQSKIEFVDMQMKCREKTALSNEEIETISSLAKKADSVEYYNAFYDLGCFFHEKRLFQEACDAYQKVPVKARLFNDANMKAASIHFVMAHNPQSNDDKRRKDLNKALLFSLRILDKNTRILVLHKIASFYLNTTNIIDPDILACLSANSSVEGCFKLFTLAHQNAQLTQELNQLKGNPATTPTLLFGAPLTTTSQREVILPSTTQPKSNDRVKPTDSKEIMMEKQELSLEGGRNPKKFKNG